MMRRFFQFFFVICILIFGFSCSVNLEDRFLDWDADTPLGFSGEAYTFKPSKYDGSMRHDVWNVSQKKFIYEVHPSVASLRINAPKGSQVFFVRTNPSLLTIPSWYTRYTLSSEGGRFASNLEDRDFNSQKLLETSSDEFIPVDYMPARNFVRPNLPLPEGRSVTEEKENYADLIREYPEGTQKRFYTDDDKTQEMATLRLKGKYCNIWVVDGYFTEGVASNTQVNRASLVYLCNQFDKSYPIVRTLFGEEQNFVLNKKNEHIPISSKVNILIYDIQKDRFAGGTLGFFWGKDFYTSNVLKSSNEGKFFYMDAIWVCKSIGLMASTLVHEFQHMINFSTKLDSATWYNEMLSLLCEDVLHSHLEISEERSPRNRLSQFCKGYWIPGLTNWLGGNDVLYSYAGAYSFGAFLIRNYGGVNLLKEIAATKSSNQESINEALRKCGVNKTFDQVFQEYVIAVLTWDCNDVNKPSFNKMINENVAGYQFDLPSINLGNYNVRSGNGKQTRGPVILSSGVKGQVTLQPYGFSLHEVGTIGEDGQLRIDFSTPYLSGEKNFILVK